MRIRGWEIDGFGVLHDVAVVGLPDGMTVVHGANEAGKSTLLEFLRRMLFGLPADGTTPYAPLHGGAHGGRLLIAGPGGDYVVARDLDQRGAPTVRRPDGSTGGGADLARLLAGADEALFRAVFAFSLDDLQTLSGLDAAGVRDALFSASLAGAGRSARAALLMLRGQSAARLNGDGPAPISERLAALHALRARLNAARQAALAYPEQRRARAVAAAARDAAAATLAARRQTAEHDAALLRAWPLWQGLEAARAERAALPAAAAPPPAVDAELAQAREQLLAARGALEALAAEQRAAQAQRDALPAVDAAVAVAADLEALSTDLTLHRFQLATLPAARQRAEDAETTWQTRRQRLAATRTDAAAPDAQGEAALREWARLGIDREQVRDWQARLQACEERARQAQMRADAAVQQALALRQRAEAIDARLPSRQPLGAAEVETRRRALAALREAVEVMLDKRSRGEAMAHALQEKEHTLRGLDAEPENAPPAWLVPTLGAGSAAAAALAAWNGAASLAAAGLAGLIALGAGGAALQLLRLRTVAGARRAEREAARRTLRSEMEAARRGRDQAWHAAAELAEQIARDAEAVELPRSPTLEELAAALRGLDADDLARASGAAVRAELAEIEPTLRAAEATAASRSAERAAAAAAYDAAMAEWLAWAARAGVGEPYEPQQVLDRVAALQSAYDALQARDAAARELRQLAPMVAAWEARARAALARGGAGDAVALGGEALAERVVALRLNLLEASPQRQRRAALDGEVQERATRLAAAEAQRAHAETALDAVLARAGVRDEAELAARRAQATRRLELERLIDERSQLLAERVDWAGADAALARGEVEIWRARAGAAAAELAALEAQLADAEAAAQAAAQACAAQEGSDELPGLEGEWAALTAELDEAVRDWRLLAAADGLIDAARQEFERSRQPAVLRQASQALAAVTGGRYQRVVQDEQGDGLLVVERDGQVKPAGGALSRGTTEQLYLAVRLGLAHALAERGTPLPLVMDDVLVNFDPERARAMAAVLGEFSHRNQILFFTCHPGMRDLLVAEGQAARVIEL
jgi:uncharacterized protein YhaN